MSQYETSYWLDGRETSWSQPQCERCYVDENGMWEVDPSTGNRILIYVSDPVRSGGNPLECCATCGTATISGIYIERNPLSVPFPRYSDEDTTSQHPSTLRLVHDADADRGGSV